MNVTRYYVLEIEKGVELMIHGPFHSPHEFAKEAQKVRDKQDPGCDSIFALQLDVDFDGCGSYLSQIQAPGKDKEEWE